MDVARQIATAKMEYTIGNSRTGEDILNAVLHHLAPNEYPVKVHQLRGRPTKS